MNVIVVGHTGEGKSTLAQLLYEFLSAHSIGNVFLDDQGPEWNTLPERLKWLRDLNPDIKVSTVQANRSLLGMTKRTEDLKVGDTLFGGGVITSVNDGAQRVVVTVQYPDGDIRMRSWEHGILVPISEATWTNEN